MKRIGIIIATFALVLVLSNQNISAQTTEFTYQGSLKISGTAANGNYDFDFTLFDNLTTGDQVGPNLVRANITVTNGIFSVSLDFGNQFPGADRFLEIRVRPSGGGEYTALTPRQLINSTPYSVKSLNAENALNATMATTATNALQLGGVAANQFVLTGDARLSDARDPLPNSPNYIQNSTNQQTTSNFNISGTGTANIINAASQFNLGGVRFISAHGTGNLFVGINAEINASGALNTFVGHFAGNDIATGTQNSFFGSNAGTNTFGNDNAFFGAVAGTTNITGSLNSFFGNESGFENTTGSRNSFFGESAGFANTSGGNNSFFGRSAGNTNTTGSNNTVIGVNSDVSVGNLTFATAVGSEAVVSTSNTIQIGRANGTDTVNVSGRLKIGSLGSLGSTAVCRNASLELSTCSSSMRYKSNVNSFSPGINLIRRLRPVSFDWKADGMSDLGLVAEEVAEIEPLLVTRNEKGEVEGIKYDRVGVVLVNAVQEQQTNIESLKKKIDEQQEIINQQKAELEAIKQLVCSQNKEAEICKPKN